LTNLIVHANISIELVIITKQLIKSDNELGSTWISFIDE